MPLIKKNKKYYFLVLIAYLLVNFAAVGLINIQAPQSQSAYSPEYKIVSQSKFRKPKNSLEAHYQATFGQVLAAQTNFLTNGDFESVSAGQLDNWELESGTRLVPDQTVVAQGAYSAKLNASYGNTRSVGWINLEGGKSYSLIFKMRCDSYLPGDWGGIRVGLYNQSFSLVAQNSPAHASYCNSQWHDFSVNYDPASNTSVKVVLGVFAASNTVATLYFDDVKLIEQGNLPPTANPVASTYSGNSPLTVNFTANASDPDGSVVSYRWNFGDGTQSTDQNTSHTYHNGGTYAANLTVWDDTGISAVIALPQNIVVSDVTQPSVAITGPTANPTFQVIQSVSTVNLSGTIALGGSGGSSIAQINWDNVNTGRSGRITVPGNLSSGWSVNNVPLKYGQNRIVVTAVDNLGYVHTDTITIDRDLVAPSAANWTATTGNSIQLFDMYELEFDVNTVADNYFYEYDANPPLGVEPEIGVTVRALITTPSGQVIQPAFYTNKVTNVDSGGEFYFTEDAQSKWYVRYAPQELGSHSVTLQIEDASGLTSQQNITTFNAIASDNKGFIGVSDGDSRYFEFSNGEIYWPVGQFQDYENIQANGANFVRPWMSGFGAYGGNWSRWVSNAENAGNEGFSSRFSYTTVFPGSELSYPLIHGNGDRLWLGYGGGSQETFFKPRLKTNTQYSLTIRFKAVNVQGPLNSSRPYGFVIKPHAWVGNDVNIDLDTTVQNTSSFIPAVKGSSDWHTEVHTFTTSSNAQQNYYFSLFLDNTTGGEVYIDYLSIKEVLAGGALGGEVVRNPKADIHTYTEARPAEYFDWQVSHEGVYHKYVVHDKNDWIQNHLNANGIFVANGNGYYQPEGTKARWLLQQWWRYVVARWGYSTQVHSWELNNEGSPDDSGHYQTTQDFAEYIHQNNAHPQMASTSFWCCWRPDFWEDNANYPDVDYADIHEYTDNSDIPAGATRDALERDMAALQEHWAQKIAASQPVGKPVIRGESGIAAGANFDALRDMVTANHPQADLWLHNLLWSQISSAAVFDPNYWWCEHYRVRTGGQCTTLIVDPNDTAIPFNQFITTTGVQNGGFVAINANVSNVNYRVIGQKNSATGKAHFWIQNKANTWYNRYNGQNPTAQNVTVTITLLPNTSYTVKRWNTYLPGGIASTTTISSNVQGNLAITLNLDTDTAYTIEPAAPLPSNTPTPTLSPTVTPTPTPIASVSEADGWFQFQKDPQNSGRSVHQVNGDYKSKWVWLDSGHVASGFPMYQSGSNNPQIDKSITDNAYVNPDLPNNYVFPDILSTGVQTVVAGSTLYVGSLDGKFFAINATNGNTIWVHQESDKPILATAAYDNVNNVIAYASMDGKIYGLNPTTGNWLWEYATGAGIMAHLKVHNGTFYFGSRDGKFYAINGNNGTLKWSQPYITRDPNNANSHLNQAPIVTTAVLSSDGSKVFFAAENMYMYALNTSDGSEAWPAPQKMVGQSTQLAVPYIITDSSGNDKVLMPTVSSLYGAEEDTTGIELFITGGSKFGVNGIRQATGYVTYSPTLASIKSMLNTYLQQEAAELRALLASNPHQEILNAFAASNGSYPFAQRIPMGRVTGNNYPPFAGTKTSLGTLLFWRGSFATLLADTTAFGTRFCPDLSLINPNTGERNVVQPTTQLNQCPELDNGFFLTSGGNMVYMQNSFRGVRAFNINSGGTYYTVTHSLAYWDGGEFRGYPTHIIYYGNDCNDGSCTRGDDLRPGSVKATVDADSGVVIARVNNKNYLFVVDPDSGAPVSAIVNQND